MQQSTLSRGTPLYATILQEDYDRLQNKLDVCQKECIRIVELYRKDKNLFEKEIEKIMSTIDNDPDYKQALGDLAISNQRYKDENAALKENVKALTQAIAIRDTRIEEMSEQIHDLKQEIWVLQKIPHTDNSAVIARLQEENDYFRKLLKEKNVRV